MRTVSFKSPKIRQALGMISRAIYYVNDRLSFGIERREFAAMLMICLMLIPIFTLPVRAIPISSSENTGFEPVNEDLAIWTNAWRSLSAKYEAWETTGREVNRINKERDVEKLKVAETTDPVKEKESAGDLNKAPSPNIADSISDEIPSDPEMNGEIIQNTAPALPVMSLLNQLPPDEQGSVYEYENNLGNPRFQTESEPANSRSAATRIRHRPGVGNFSFDVPLAGLSGRGLDAGISMSYNSRIWNVSCSYGAPVNQCNPANLHFKYDVEQNWIAPGFSSGFGYLESFIQSNGLGGYKVSPRGIVQPTGNRSDFVCKGYSGAICQGSVTKDGSFLKTQGQIDTYGSSMIAAVNFSVHYPNGMMIQYAGAVGSNATSKKHYPVLIRDRNGNMIRIAYTSNTSDKIAYIQDTLGRQIKFYYENDINGQPDKLVAVTIPGMNTNEEIQTIRFYYDTVTWNSSTNFMGTVTGPAATFRVLKYVYMPSTKTGYKYTYDSTYGMITKITRLAGMTVSSTSTSATGSVTSDGIIAATTEYNFVSDPEGDDVPKYNKRTDDWAGRGGSDPVQETIYFSPQPDSGDDFVTSISVRDTSEDLETVSITNGANDWKRGLIKEVHTNRLYGSIDPITLARSNSEPIAKTVYFWNKSSNIPYIEKIEETTHLEGGGAGLTKATEFEYDQYFNQTKVKEYDYAPAGTLGTLLRTTETSYETGSGWINRNLLSLPKTVKTVVGGVTVSKTELTYDNGGNDSLVVRRSDINTQYHHRNYNPDKPARYETFCPNGDLFVYEEAERDEEEESERSADGCVNVYLEGYTAAYAYRGNVTEIKGFSDATLNTDPNANTTSYNYDITGNVVSASLSCCNVKTISYSVANQYAFPMSETKGSSPQLTTSATYNTNTGLPLTSTDENGEVTQFEYESDTLRPKKTIYPNGGYVETEYSDKLVANIHELLPEFVRQTTTLTNSNTAQSYSYFDGRGIGIRSATQTPDGWLISAAITDHLGRPRKSYNPFYGTTPLDNIPGGTAYTEVTGIDVTGRMTQATLQDGTTISTAYSSGANRPNGFNKTFVTSTDQAGKQRRQIFDSLGRLVRLDEPNGAGALGAVDSPNLPTAYEYDGNDNLSKVTMSDGVTTQERRFKYDSLSRLIAERQVEASPTLDLSGTKGAADPDKWTKVLKYNMHGLLTDGWDARGVRTQMTYDGLNRLASVTYSGEAGFQTPAVTYTYDQTRSGFYNAGALTRVETAATATNPSTATEFDYDKMGRVAKQRQYIDTQEFAMEYGYNLAGQLTSQKYPSGRVVTNGYDANGRLSQISDQARTYLSNLEFEGLGGSLSSMTMGNGTVQTFAMNNRFQMTQQELKKGSDVLQKYVYGYGQIDGSGNLDTAKNNGQLGRVESWIGANKQWTQKFKYDSLGRLTESSERRGDNDALTYQQTFDFDRFGNMYRKAANNNPTGQANPLPYTAIEDADISKATNRFTADTTYDEAGNVTVDDKFRDLGYSYDANGRMVKATKAATPDAGSVYDASGMRVAEKINDVWRFLIYDIGGKCIAEYGGAASTDEGGVKYPLKDWQGSTRGSISNSGNVRSRQDFTAFGEEIGAGTGLRTAAQGFGASDTLREKYGLTERDDATGLDHTWFRKHENQAGRWTSPDPYNGSMSLGSSQSFNRYSYVENQPTNFIDPSGLMASNGFCVTWVYGTEYKLEDGTVIRIPEGTHTFCFGGGGGSGAGSGVTLGYGGGGGRAQTKLSQEACDKKIAAMFGGPGAVAATDKEPQDLPKVGGVSRVAHLADNGTFHLYTDSEGSDITVGLYAPKGWIGKVGPVNVRFGKNDFGTEGELNYNYFRFNYPDGISISFVHVGNPGVAKNDTNEAGSVRIGNIAGPKTGGEGPGYNHSHINVYKNGKRIDPRKAFCGW